MTKQLKTTIIILCFGVCLNAQTNQLKWQLFELPDVIFEQIDTPEGFDQAYKLMIKQPIDHKNLSKGHFYQKAYLSHVSVDNPTVIITEGYNRNRNRVYELSTLLNANQIDVEHRFYGESVPDSMEYQYLTLEQATADLHRINKMFKKIYDQKWVSTGISKGGQTTIYYRYFYPDDVDVSVPYVAPLNIELEETRIYDFLDTIGTEECRTAITDVQIRLLENRAEVFEKLKWFAKGANLNYSYLNFEEAMEYAILEYPFSFWQWGASCDDIPAGEEELDKAIDHFLTASGISFFSDRDMEAFASHYYQAGSQMGYYSYNTEGFEHLLKALPTDPNPSAVFMPKKMKVPFDNSLPKKVDKWIKDNGDQFIYINGANDTWSATAVQPNKKRDALWFNLAGKDHGQARIKNMTEAERAKMIKRLEKWLNWKIEER